jgi:hypothetical protein
MMKDRRRTIETIQILGLLSLALSMLCMCGSLDSLSTNVILNMKTERYQRILDRIEQDKQKRITRLEEIITDRELKAEEKEKFEELVAEIEASSSPLGPMKVLMNPVVRASSLISVLLGITGNIFLMAAGFGLILLKSWGRKMGITAAVFNIVQIVLYALVLILFLWPAWMNMVGLEIKQSGTASLPAGVLEVFDIFGFLYAGILVLVVSAWPAVLLFMLSRESVREFFADKRPEGVSES